MAYSIVSDSFSETILSSSDYTGEMFCELCTKNSNYSVAVGFCVDCVKYFCDKCLNYHRNFLASHVVQDYQTMPDDFCLEHCDTHPAEIIKFICFECDSVACSACKLRHHMNCKDVKHIPTFIRSQDFTQEIKRFKEVNKNNKNRLQWAADLVDSNISQIRVYCNLAKSDLKQHRKEINEKLDNAEREIENLIEQSKDEYLNKISKYKVLLEEALAKSDDLDKNMESKENTANRSKLFLFMQKAKANVRQLEADIHVQQLDNEDNMQIHLYKYSPDERFQTFFRNFTRFGSLIDDNSGKRSKKGKPLSIFGATEKYTDVLGKLEEHVTEKEPSKIRVAVAGNIESGKSTFIQTLLGSKFEKIKMLEGYASPNLPNILIFKLPAVTSELFLHSVCVNDVQLDDYDFYIIMFKCRVTKIETSLANTIRTIGKKFYLVKSHVQEDIDNDQESYPTTHNPEKVINIIRADCTMRFKDDLKDKLFLIDNFETDKFDFGKLIKLIKEETSNSRFRGVTAC